MATKTKGRKSLNFYMCETVYTSLSMNLHKHKSTRQAIYDFVQNSETFEALAEGKIHNKFIVAMERNTPDKLLNYKEYNKRIESGETIQDEFTELRATAPEGYPKLHDIEAMKQDMIEGGYDYIEPDSGEHFTKADMNSMIEERDRIMLEIGRVAGLGDRSDKTSTGYSDKAYKQIWRMCESYEKYCIETNQPGPLPLNIVKK